MNSNGAKVELKRVAGHDHYLNTYVLYMIILIILFYLLIYIIGTKMT